MKKISPAIVLIKAIYSSQPRSAFAEIALEQAARLILAIEGVINPIILMRTGVSSYEVINGHFEYYAALKAKEIDAIRGETINAYILESEEEKDIYVQQIAVFRSPHLKNIPDKVTKSSHFDEIVKRLQALENKFTALTDLTKNIGDEIKGLCVEIGTLTPSETFTLPETGLRKPVAEPIPPPVKTIHCSETVVNLSKPTTEEQQFLEILNTLPIQELASKLSKIKGIKKDIINKIESARREKPFESLNDIKLRKIGVGVPTLAKIMARLLA